MWRESLRGGSRCPKAQAEAIREVTGQYRQATLATLRLAFPSALVLELIATLSVALVAVGVGLRLVDGHLDLRTGLLVLILAPEAYLPLRHAAAQFHASAGGLTAAGEVLAVLETQAGAGAAAPSGGPRRTRSRSGSRRSASVTPAARAQHRSGSR